MAPFDRLYTNEFLLAFHSNYGAILYRLQDTASYCSKIAKFLYPPIFSAHAGGGVTLSEFREDV